LLIDSEPKADVRASSAGAACPCRTTRKDTLRGTTPESCEASHDEACSPSADQDGSSVVPRKPWPCRSTPESDELLCGITKGTTGSSSENERSSVSVCELRDLQERLRTACLPTGRVSDLAAFAVKPPASAKGKLRHHMESPSSVSTMDTGSDDLEDDKAGTPKRATSLRRMQMVCLPGPVNSTVSTTDSLDPLWITTRMKNVGSTSSVNTSASVEPFDFPGLQIVAEAEPKHIEIKKDIEEHKSQGEGTLQQEGVTSVAISMAANSQRWPKQVPWHRDLAKDFKMTMSRGAADPVTTLMIRNIPHRYTRRDLIVELEGLGFAGGFDFLYLPLNKNPTLNLGYAFVNFIKKSVAELALQTIPGNQFKLYRMSGSRKLAKVSVAYIQGLERNMKHYSGSAVNAAMSKERSPVIVASLYNFVGGDS